jgi:hypothetical protein
MHPVTSEIYHGQALYQPDAPGGARLVVGEPPMSAEGAKEAQRKRLRSRDPKVVVGEARLAVWRNLSGLWERDREVWREMEYRETLMRKREEMRGIHGEGWVDEESCGEPSDKLEFWYRRGEGNGQSGDRSTSESAVNEEDVVERGLR